MRFINFPFLLDPCPKQIQSEPRKSEKRDLAISLSSNALSVLRTATQRAIAVATRGGVPGFLALVLLFPSQPVRAQKDPKFNSCTLDPNILAEDGRPNPNYSDLITAYTFSQEGMTHPSLWWAQEQFGKRKLLMNWIAYPTPKRLDLIVNLQIWSNLQYIERYSFIHHFGTVARDYGYELRVFNQRGDCLALYTCDRAQNATESDRASSPPCRIIFDPVARGRFSF